MMTMPTLPGWRARLGFLLPPGNPTVEPEMQLLAPEGVSVHFTRMVARGVTGSHDGQEERTRSQLDRIDECVEMLAHLRPDVIVLAHTATSYLLGEQAELRLLERLQALAGTRVITAFGSVVQALRHLGVQRVALGTPYDERTTAQGLAELQARGFEVVRHGRLTDVRNIYLETPQRAYGLARSVDAPQAQAVFLSGVGMPTVTVLDALERDLGKPALSSAAAMMWHALRTAGVEAAVPGYGRLLAGRSDPQGPPSAAS